jgi:hypothetical protein
VTLVFVVPLQRTVPPSYAAKSVSCFWYPPCTELMVTQSVCYSSTQSSPRSFWKFFRKLWYRETTFSTQALVDFSKEFISHNWASCTSVPPSLNFLHHSLTQLSLITLSPYTRHNRRWISAALCPVKKTNHSTYFRAGGNDDDSVHVSSVIIQ